jgi:hypothetical protein
MRAPGPHPVVDGADALEPDERPLVAVEGAVTTGVEQDGERERTQDAECDHAAVAAHA